MTMVTVVTVILMVVAVCKTPSPSSRPTRKFGRGAGRTFQRVALPGNCPQAMGRRPVHPVGRKGAFVTFAESNKGFERKKGIYKMKHVQITEELFFMLARFHLLDDAEYSEEIREELEKKLDAMTDRRLYTTYKTAESAGERERARQEYLDRKGVFPSFRW